MENVLGHKFIATNLNGEYFCKDCGIVVFENWFQDNNKIYIANRWRGEQYLGKINIILNITCDQVLIKSILE